jgi:hypothetical protein
MPYASSNRYQSRIFNFVDQQSRRLRLGDRLQRTFRHVQVATGWSLQALLYPVYLLFQKAIDSAGKQLRPQEQQPQQWLQAHDTNSLAESLSVDTPIVRVLEAVEHIQENEDDRGRHIDKQGEKESVGTLFRQFFGVISTKLARSHSPTPSLPDSSTPRLLHSSIPPLLHSVRGIASELVSRSLVLVTDKNEILNILTVEQQEKLQERIITEIAKYWRNWRLTSQKEETKLFNEIDHLLTKLTSGVKDKPPALLPENIEPEEESKLVSLEHFYPALALLDTTVANLESRALLPISRASSVVQQHATDLIHVIRTQLNLFIYGKEQLTTSTPSSVTIPESENQTIKIQALIWAAINFFFGSRHADKLQQRTSATNISGKQPDRVLPQRPVILPWFNSQQIQSQQIQSKELVDLWLSESDLFYDFQSVKALEKQQQPTSHQFSGLSVTSSTIRQQEIESNRGEIFQPQHSSDSRVEAKPDWIETKAKTIGYEKHPLVHLLEWLDQVMLKLEELFVKIFHYIQKLLQVHKP